MLKQQGRVDLDAESIEADEIAAHLRQTQTQEAIGLCGFPETGGGFGISSTQPRLTDGRIDVDLTISPGRGYVDGILCESEAEFVPISKILTDSGTQVHRANVPTLTVDGRELQRGQWVEISTVGFLVQPKLAQITGVDVRNQILEFDVDISEFRDKPSQLRRVTTYTTQPDYPNPKGLDLDSDLAQGDCAMRTWSTFSRRRDRCEDCSAFSVVRKDGSHNAPSHRAVGSPKVRMEA